MSARDVNRSERTHRVALLTAGKRRVVGRYASVYAAHAAALWRVSTASNPRAAFIVSDGDPDSEFVVSSNPDHRVEVRRYA